MKYVSDIKEFIGNILLIKFIYIGIKENVNIFVKLECFNLGGSIKDRIGVSMIEGVEKEGILKKGYIIIDVIVGNIGFGIVIGVINKGYNIIFVVLIKFLIEK